MASKILEQSLGTLRSLAGRGDYMANIIIKVFDELLVGQKGGLTARFASTADRAALSGLANTGLDGTPIEGDIILLKDQTDLKQNGLYVASAGAWARVVDDAGNVLLGPNMLIPVREGSTLADKLFQVTSNTTVVGTDDIEVAEVGGAPSGGGAHFFAFWTTVTDIIDGTFQAIPPGGNNAGDPGIPMPPCTLGSLRINYRSTAAVDSWIVVVQRNGPSGDTSVQHSYSGNTTASVTLDCSTLSYAEGDSLELKIIQNENDVGATTKASFLLEYFPE